MRSTILALIAVAALAVLAAPASAQYPQSRRGIYPSLTPLPHATSSMFPGNYTIYPAPNTPLSPAVANYPFLAANGRVYTMGQMYQAYGFAPYYTPPAMGGYYYPGYAPNNWRW